MLHRVKTLKHYTLDSLDGAMGKVKDFYFDDQHWTVRYLIVDTRNWWPGKKVVVAPEWITDVSWSGRSVGINLDRATIKSGPEWDPVKTPERPYEERLYRHYAHAGYWL